jgi:hypothetical protein
LFAFIGAVFDTIIYTIKFFFLEDRYEIDSAINNTIPIMVALSTVDNQKNNLVGLTAGKSNYVLST